MNKSSDSCKATKKREVNSKKRGFPCCPGRIFTEGLLTRPRCARRKWRTRPKRTNLKRLRRNGQRWRNGSSEGIDTPDAKFSFGVHAVCRSRMRNSARQGGVLPPHQTQIDGF